jgi:magnesium-transporting ATPase (P-type)
VAGGGAGKEGQVAAIVIRTGYLTAKGSLVRSILFPKESSNDFFKDAVRFIFALATLAGIGMIYQVARVHELVCR